MKSRATNDLMDTLHRITAEELTDIIKKGIPVYNKETGEETGREPAPASYIAAAIKFLKDNDITSDPTSGRMDPVEEALQDVPTFENEEAPDNYPYN